MLERATACLKVGAKDSLKCAQHRSQHQASRSKCKLHQAFWTHGAGDLDLPSCALGTLRPSDLPFKHSGSQRPSKRGGLKSTGAPITHTDDVFLDFLYPPYALAWLQKTGARYRERWERQNTRRLSEGFNQASRGYSSSCYRRSSMNTTSLQLAVHDEHEQECFERRSHNPTRTKTSGRQESVFADQDNAQTEQSADYRHLEHIDRINDHQAEMETSSTEVTVRIRDTQSESAVEQEATESTFADSPGDMAEADADMHPDKALFTNPIHSLRSLMAGLKPARGQDKIALAWALYNMLDEADRQDSRLKNELLIFLAARQNVIADAHCISLYLSLPLEARVLSTYQAVLPAFLRRHDNDSALGLHQESLSNLVNSSQVTKALFHYAIQHQLTTTAVKVKEQHHTVFSNPGQRAIFWLNVSEIPDLVTVAALFVKKTRLREKASRKGRFEADTMGLLELSAKLSEEAINQVVQHRLPSRDEMESFKLTTKIYLLCNSLYRWTPEQVPQVFENAMILLLQHHGAQPDGANPGSRVDFARAYHIVSYMYRLYRKTENFRPSELLLTLFFNQLLHRNIAARRSRRGQHSVAISTIIKDWKATHTKLSSLAVHRLMGFHAANGNVEQVADAFQYLLQCYPLFTDQKPALWTLIYVHARRADVVSTIRAFGEIRRLAKANGDTVDPKWWNILITAHYRSDDVDGAFITFKKMLDSGVKPTPLSVEPILRLVANRGDVRGVQDLFDQYDELSDTSPNTNMVSCLMVALVIDGRISEAEDVLHKTIADRRASEISGSLTLCFDVLVQAYAQRKDLDAVMRIYSWMKAEEIRLSSKTYSSLMRALCNYHQTHGAWRILTSVLPQEGLEVTAHHFAIIMEGYNNQGVYARTLQVYQKMLNREIRPNIEVQKAYFTARAFQEQRLRARRGQNRDMNGNPLPLTDVQKSLQKAIRQQDGSELARTRRNVAAHEISVSGTSELLSPIMLLHAKRRNLEQVKQLYDLYMEKVRELGQTSGMIPMRILGAVMSALMYAGRYDEVEMYWKVAKDQADMFAAHVAVPDFRSNARTEAKNDMAVPPGTELHGTDTKHEVDGAEIGFAAKQAATQGMQTLMPRANTSLGPKPVSGRSRMLSTVVRYYFRALVAQGRIADLVMTWTRLLKQGYTFDNTAWNRVIEYLCTGSSPLALLAFTLTERFLIPNFPGWSKKTNWTPAKAARATNFQYINTRYIDERNVLLPQYRTMQHLAAALLKMRKMEASGYAERPHKLGHLVGSIAQIRQHAPRTLRHVQTMPHVDDYWQNRLLRQQREGYNVGQE